MREYTLSNPLVELTFDHRPSTWLIVSFFVASTVFFIGLLYLYAVVFPNIVGFETAVLVGIATIAFGVGN